MQNLFTDDPTGKRRALLGAITGAVGVLLAMFLVPMTAANAAADGDHLVVDGCTIDLPFGYGYEANGSPIDAGTQYLASFYPSATIDQLDGPDQLVVESIDIDVPLECAVEVSATCDTVTFHTTLGADWWSSLQILYGDDGGIPLGDAYFTSDTVTVPLDYNPFSYAVYDREMDRQFGDLLTLDCDDPAIPTVAPDSGM